MSEQIYGQSKQLGQQLGVDDFLADGFDLRRQLAEFLQLSPEELEQRLPRSTEHLAALHPGAFDPQRAEVFYEQNVGDAHLLELAAWHLNSADYIADTLRLQQSWLPDTSHSETVMRQPAVGPGVAVAVAQSA